MRFKIRVLNYMTSNHIYLVWYNNVIMHVSLFIKENNVDDCLWFKGN